MPPCATIKFKFKCVYMRVCIWQWKNFEYRIGFMATHKSTYTSPHTPYTAYIHLFWFNVFRFVRDILYMKNIIIIIILYGWMDGWMSVGGVVWDVLLLWWEDIINDMQLNMGKKINVVLCLVVDVWCGKQTYNTFINFMYAHTFTC